MCIEWGRWLHFQISITTLIAWTNLNLKHGITTINWSILFWHKFVVYYSRVCAETTFVWRKLILGKPILLWIWLNSNEISDASLFFLPKEESGMVGMIQCSRFENKLICIKWRMTMIPILVAKGKPSILCDSSHGISHFTTINNDLKYVSTPQIQVS